MLNEFRSTLITWDKATSRIYSPITANESDENGRKLVVQVVNGGPVEDLTGSALHLYWETIDKLHEGLDVFKAVDLKKGMFELSYTTGMLSNKGALKANLVLVNSVGRIVSDRFRITVKDGIDNDAVQSENSFTTLTQALIDISNLEQNYAPRLNNLTAQLQQIVRVNFKPTDEADITSDLQNAINVVDSEGGGVINFPIRNEPYKIVSGNISLCDNLTMDFKNNTLNITSSDNLLAVFQGFNVKNLTIKNVNFISTNDKQRKMTTDGSLRSGLGSNVSAFYLHGENIYMENIYFESLEFGYQIKNSYSEATGLSDNVELSNIRSYKTKQPLYLANIKNSRFSNLIFDLTDSIDSHDHHVYINGNTQNLTFRDLVFNEGDCWSFNIKTDYLDRSRYTNGNISIYNLTVTESGGIYLEDVKDVTVDNYNIEVESLGRYGVFRFGHSKNIRINTCSANYKGQFFATGVNDRPSDIYIENTSVRGVSQDHKIILFNCDNIVLNNVHFDDVGGADERLIYAGGGYTRNVKLKNCSLYIPSDSLANNGVISFRGNDFVIIDNCSFISSKKITSTVLYNLSPAVVIAKNNLFSSTMFNGFIPASDTGTSEHGTIPI